MQTLIFKKKNKKIRLFFIFLFIFIVIFLYWGKGRSAINSVVLTPATPTTLSNGLGYYLAGFTYTFTVQVIDPDAAGWADITNVILTIPNNPINPPIVISIDPTWPNPQTPTITGGPVDATVTINANTPNNFIVTFSLTFRWNTQESAWAASRSITASATSTNTRTDTRSVSYGVCASTRVLNFSQNGEAADGMINPYYALFQVSGVIVYNVTGATTADAINSRDPGELTGTTLFLDGSTAGLTGLANDDSPTITVNPGNTRFTGSANLGNHTWTINATMDTAPLAEESSNGLSIINNRVLVTGLTVSQGGGRNAAPYYWRSRLVPGTRFTVNAQMQSGVGGMAGNTTFTINSPTGGAQFTVQIPNGSTSASVVIPTASIPGVASGTTANYIYSITQIQGNSYGEQGDGTFNAAPLLEIVDNINYAGAYYTSPRVYWDNADPPGSDNVTPIPTTRQSPDAQSISLFWAPINTGTSSFDGDFYEYRVHFREGTTGTFKHWDGDDDPELRGIANNPYPAPVSDPTLQFDQNGWKYTLIPGLKVYTQYQFYITAIDVFGNETQGATPLYDIRTLPFDIEIAISDGITRYENNSFLAGLDPSIRPVRESNIMVETTIITSERPPDTVRVWYTTGNISTAPDIVNTGSNTINSGAFPPDTLFSAEAKRAINPNKWIAYLPTTTAAIRLNNQVRFIVETSLDNVSSFSDSDVSDYLPNDDEWTFYVATRPTFTPWPTRILNNVITDKNPLCYPSYYLSADAYVTLTVYDIKGRPVATIIDSGFRKGGQNIKEGGWAGKNKASRKLGAGLYYMHFKAKRASDGKTILNEKEKVVIAR